jgi:hypothetical protein
MSASNAIASGAVVLSANADAWAAGLNKSKADLEKWQKSTTKMVEKAGGGAKGGGGGILGTALGTVTGLGVVDVATNLWAYLDPLERLNEMAKQGDIAQSLGLTPEAFTSIAGAAQSAGSDTRDFLEGLITLSGKAMDAAAGRGEDAARIFQELKVNAGEFAQLDPEKQFYGIFEALNAVENPAQRVNLLLKAFGEDTGKNMTRLLGKTTAELKTLAGEFTITTEAIARSQVAANALTLAKAKLNAAINEIAVALSPVITGFADHVPAAIKVARDFLEKFSVERTVKSAARTIAWLVTKFEQFRGSIIEIFGQIQEMIGDTIKAIGRFVRTLGTIKDWKGNNILNINGADQFLENLGGNIRIDGIGKQIDGWMIKRDAAQYEKSIIGFVDLFFSGFGQRVADQMKKLVPGPVMKDLPPPPMPEPVPPPPMLKLAGAAERGSSGAYSIQANYMASQLGLSTNDDVQKQQLRKQTNMVDLLRNVDKHLERLGVL